MADLEAEAAAHVTSDACTPARRPPTRPFTADSDRASRSARHARAQRVSASDFEARDFQSRPVDRVVPSDDMTDAEMADAPPPAAAEGAAAADAAETQIAIGATVTLTKNTGDGIVANDDALAFAKRKASASVKSRKSSAAAKRRAANAGMDADDEMDGDIIDEKDEVSDDDDDEKKKKGRDEEAPKKLKTLKGDASFVHYGGDCYVQSTQRPGGGTFDLVFQLYDQDGEYYPFANTDARGLYAPGKEAALLRSKVAVARYLERDGMTEEDLAAVEAEASAFRASELAAAAPVFYAPREPRASRAAAAKKPLRDLDSDEELSDLLASDDDEGYESESEPLDKIEKIVFCAEAIEVPDAELEELGTEDARRVAAEAKRKAKVAKGKPVWLYCVKWEGCSYRRRSWETAADVKAAYKAASKLQSFQRRHDKDPDATTTPFPSDYLLVDRVIDVREALPEEEQEERAANTPGSARKANRGKEKTREASPASDSDDDAPDDADASLQYLVKWRGLGYADATWEAAESLESETDANHVARFELRDDLKEKKKTYAGAVERAKAGEKPPSAPTPPAFKNGMALREYQVSSFEWMVGNYRRRKNVILGDEMGLGKTAQCISVMEHVRTTLLRAPRPFLVVAPLTTLGHWKREMEKWTNMNVVVLDGNAEDRRVCEETEFYFSSKGRGKGPAKFDVLLVSFETARRLTDTVASFEWALCVVDEAHKLKDVNSQTTQSVMDIPYEWLLLLTGTPIQNNVRELFGMMHVLDPEAYPSWEEFQERFCDGGKEVDATQVMRLRDVLKPRMLRRMKEDVETIPAKEEIVVWVELTPEQRNYYRAIYEKQVHVLLEGAKAKHVPQLRNLCMELRKVCNHPFLCDGLESDYGEKKRKALAASAERAKALAVEKGLAAPPPPPAEPTPLELLVGSSGKMTLVAKLLPKLKSQGKKVLIFSQFTIVLDLLEDYLHEMSYEFERLDGSTSQADRQAGIDRFNRDGSGFVYLLSTRAGGMGITLTAADTAVIYDSDWNPQNDLQAMARCHRIGQTKEVKVYRLVTKATYEQSLFETSAKKYGLDEAVLGGGDGADGGGAGAKSAKEDAAKINRLLKYGVHGALRDSSGEEAAAFEKEDIDQILGKRAEHRAIGARAGNTFSTAVFSAAGEEEDFDAEDFWAKALPEATKAARDAETAFGQDALRGLDDRFRVTGPRKRKGMYDSYKEGAVGMVGKKTRRRRGDDDDFSGDDESRGSFSDDDDDRATRGAKRASKHKNANAKSAAKKTDAWLDRDLKALEDALVSFGVGVDGACVRATNAALEAMALRRPFKQARAVASCLAEMMERTAKVNKARADELEREQAEARAKAGEAGGAAALARCEVCESMKKGRCGTETAPRSCLKLPPAVAAEMDARGGGVDEGGVPVGMSRATWEQTVEVCEAAIEERRAGIPENALAALERANLYKRLASGWQRAAKCGKERAALSAALEVAVGVEGDDISNVPPAEKAEGDFDSPNVQRGALPAWWSAETDAALLRGSLRHGFSPWSAELLDAQFEKIRVDPTLLFAELECAPPEPEGKKREAKQDEPGGSDDASPARMPGRETLKRRLLKLLDCLVRPRPAPPPPKEKPAKAPREAKPRAPTKREQKEAAREAAAVARKAADAERAAAFAAALTGGQGQKNGDASGMKESPPGATVATRKASDRLSLEAAERDVSSGMSPTSPMASPKADGGADAEAPAAKKARATPEKAAEKTATLAPAKKAATPEKKAATPEKKAATPAKKAATPAKKAATPAKRSPARARAESPASPASGPARSPLSANAARRSPRPSPRAVAKPAARAVAAAERLAADQDPLATLVLGGGGGGPGSARDSFRTPGAGFKKAGASKTAGAAGKQTSLLGLGFFSKTPAGAGAGAPAARTPTTGGF